MALIYLNGQLHAWMTTICRFDSSLTAAGRIVDDTTPVIHPRPKRVNRKLMSFELN